jgi:hypothetical protein
MAVHDINVHPIGSALFDGVYFSAEFGEVSGENGGGDQEGAGFHGLSFLNAKAKTGIQHRNTNLANLLLQNPTTGLSSFGYIEEVRVSGILIPGGCIYLKQGEHRGPNHGFGAAHIWAEHAKEMLSVGFASMELVPAFVATIVQPGARVYFEGSQLRGGKRVSVVRTSNGMAVLEHKGTWGNPSYSIVTAYLKAKTHGTLVGTVREFKV